MNQNEAKGIFLKALPGLTEPLKSAVEFTLANWHKLRREPRPSDVALNFFANLPAMPDNTIDMTFAAKLNKLAKLIRDDPVVWLSLEDLPHEEWRDVVGYEGFYQVSGYGRVKSFQRGKVMILSPTKCGRYLYVTLFKPNYRSNFFVHGLVAKAFYPNPENLPVVHHRDDDKHNPSVWNLEWVTYSKNAKFAFESGAKKSFGHVKKLTPDQVRYIRKNYKRYDKEFGARALGQKFNVNPNVIVNVVRYKSYKNVV